MTHAGTFGLVLLLGVIAGVCPASAQQSATEAPAGFDTPTLVANPGSQSTSNGIAEPPGDTFALDQQVYEQVHDVTTGLGPVYNGRACAECHQNPVSGGASQFTELRAGHRDASGTFVNPTVPIDRQRRPDARRAPPPDRVHRGTTHPPQAEGHPSRRENSRLISDPVHTYGTHLAF